MGRVGSWLAAHQLPIEPDIVAMGKGSAPGTRRSARCSAGQHVYDAIDRGSREFDLGHTWDGAPLSSAVGLAVLDLLVERGLVDRVRDRGPEPPGRARGRARGFGDRARGAGQGFLLGVELVDPRDGESFLPVELDVASLVDDAAFEHGTPRHVDPSAGRRLRGRPDAPRARLREHGRGARGDGRSLPGHDRGRGAVDQGLPVEPTAPNEPDGAAARSSCSSAIPDMNGSLRGKALRPAAFEAAVQHGTVMTDLIIGLDPVDTPITDYERFGIRTGAADLLVHPRPGHRPRPRLAARLADLSGHAQLARRLPVRLRLARGLPDASSGDVSSLGYEVMSAIEYEIRLWDEQGAPMSSGISYSLNEIGRYDRFVDALVGALAGLGVELSAVHTEAGPGAARAQPGARPGLAAADGAVLVKFATKQVAASMGLRASFLAKTVPGEEGSSGHVHLSCWDGDTNAFAGAAADDPLPAPLGAAIAGVLEHLPAASLLLNPTVNSYKRLVPGWFAPINATWGYENRSCAVRAIRSARPELWRFECRRPGADANPYLALAAIAASAADGIRRKATPPAPIEGDAYARSDLPELPGSLEAAIAAFGEDDTLQEALGHRIQRLLRDVPRLGAQGLARDRHRLGTRPLRPVGMRSLIPR